MGKTFTRNRRQKVKRLDRRRRAQVKFKRLRRHESLDPSYADAQAAILKLINQE